MNLANNWRDRRTVFTTPHNFSIVNYSTEVKNDMKAAFGEELFLGNLHLIPDPLMKNLADSIITDEKMAPKSKSEMYADVKTNQDMLNQPDYSPLSGITSFFSGVMSVISNAMFSKRKQSDFVDQTVEQMAVPPPWHGAKISDENKILRDENHSSDMGSENLVSEMTDCRKAAAHCQNKIEQVRHLLGSKPVPCRLRTRSRVKKVFVDAGSVEDCFEDAFSPEDFENIANDSNIKYSSPVCYHDHVFHEIDTPKLKIETCSCPEEAPESPAVCETTEIVKNVPEIENNVETDTKTELVASCEDKISKLKALLQERRKKPKTVIEPEPISVPELKVPEKPKNPTKVKDKRFKNPNRTCAKRMKSKMRKNIQDDLLFAHDINSEDLSSVENSPSMGNFEKYVKTPVAPKKEYFDEVSGRFHSGSVTDTDCDDSFQIVFNDIPKLRRSSDCESEDSFIVFEESPDSCYTSNDVFGETDSEDYDSDSDLSDSGCGTFNLPSCLSKSICNLADDSLYTERSEDEVDCAVKDVTVCDSVAGDIQSGELKTGLLLDERKKRLRKDLPPKRVQFSEKPPKVHVMRVWAFAARQARAGHWERYTLDRDRFKRRIADVDMAVAWVLKPQHRSRVMFQRFMPWWNAQKRKELAEKKEREAQELLEEERLRALEAEKEVSGTSSLDDKEQKLTELEDEKEMKSHGDDRRELKEVNTKREKEELKSEDKNKNYTDNVKTSSEFDSENHHRTKLSSENDMCKNVCNNQIIPLNDKILDIESDYLKHSVLHT